MQSQSFQRDFGDDMYFFSSLKSMMNLILVLIAKRAFADVLDVMKLKNSFSLRSRIKSSYLLRAQCP